MKRLKQWVSKLSVKKKLIFYGYLIITPVLVAVCIVLVIYNYNNQIDKVLEKEREQIRDNIIEYFEVQQAEVRKEPIAGEMPVVIGIYPKRRKSVIREKKFEIDAEMQKALDQF